MAKYMKNMVPGMDVPDEFIERLQGVPKEDQAEEGIKICVESIQRLRAIEGVHGVHVMAIEWGLHPRPKA
jgi:methylenetetrahydrofolate reductase (NADPH)